MTIAQRARRPRPAPPPAPTEEIRGRVERVRFYNPENGYAVLSVSVGREEITAVGNLLDARQDADLILRGVFKEHPKFGRQFCFTEHEVILPRAREGIVSYLAATVAGIGPIKAGKIADALGDEALEIIKTDPDRLRAVPGITPAQAEEIISKVKANETLAELSAMICGEGITPNLAAKICAKYGAEAVRKVRDNPYILADELRGIGFITADKIARGIGIAPDAPFRVQAAILYLLNVAGEEGHVYLRPREIVEQLPEITGAMSGITTDQIAAAVNELIRLNKVIREDNRIYLVERHQAEVELAAGMKRLLAQGPREVPEWAISYAEELAGISYADSQKKALEMALASPLSIVTGGPGTGKSTILRGIVAVYEKQNPEKPIYLAAPTGRAAKRITETTGREASTIHRLLAYHPEYGFQYNADHQLPTGLLVVDESSMMDLDLANALFAALPADMQTVLVGDIDQLPSVGPGSVLRDAIDSGVVPTTRLEYNYRQAAGSTIALYAHKICRGETPDLDAKAADFVAYEADEAEDAVSITLKQVEQALAEGYTASDFQILTPMRKTPTGVHALNHLIREMVNPPAEGKAEVKYGGTVFRAGDKVMQVKNNYRKGVFNGDIGFVTEIATGGGGGSKIAVRFDETVAEYEYTELGELELAYASTVHKSQGSEFPLVICLCLRQHFVLLQRNLLYTAITRAKHKLILIHQPRAGKKAGAVEIAIKNNLIQARNSYLAERLRSESYS